MLNGGLVITRQECPDESVVSKTEVVDLLAALSHVSAHYPLPERPMCAGMQLYLSCYFLPKQIIRRNGVWGC